MFDGEGSPIEIGEFELWCTTSGPGYTCPSNAFCKTDEGNPHFGFAGFDDFYQAFILQFQVQTLSTACEYGLTLTLALTLTFNSRFRLSLLSMNTDI